MWWFILSLQIIASSKSVNFNVVVFCSNFIMMVFGNSSRFTPDTCDYPACNNDPVLCPGTMVCEPIDKDILDHLELFCLSVFVMDFGVRVMLCPFMPGR